jgi:hypothetical protein
MSVPNFWVSYFWSHYEYPVGSGNVIMCSACNTEDGCGPCDKTCFPCAGCPCVEGNQSGQKIMFMAVVNPVFSGSIEQDMLNTCPTGQATHTCSVSNDSYCCGEYWREEDWVLEGCNDGWATTTIPQPSYEGYKGLRLKCPEQPPFPCPEDPNPLDCGRETNMHACCAPGCPTCWGDGPGPRCIRSECACHACSGTSCVYEKKEYRLTGQPMIAHTELTISAFGGGIIDEFGNPCGFGGTLVGNSFFGIADDGPCGSTANQINVGPIGYADENGEFMWKGMKFEGIPSYDIIGGGPHDQYDCPGTIFVGASVGAPLGIGCGPVLETGCGGGTSCSHGPTTGCRIKYEALYAGQASSYGNGMTYSKVGEWCSTAVAAIYNDDCNEQIYRSGGEVVYPLASRQCPGPNRGSISPSSFTVNCSS